MNLKELKREILELEQVQPLLSFYTCLATVIRGKYLDTEQVSYLFKLVPRDEFSATDKDEIIRYLVKLSKIKREE